MADVDVLRLRSIERRAALFVHLATALRRAAGDLERAADDIRYLLDLIRRSAVELNPSGVYSTARLQELPPLVPDYQRVATAPPTSESVIHTDIIPRRTADPITEIWDPIAELRQLLDDLEDWSA